MRNHCIAFSIRITKDCQTLRGAFNALTDKYCAFSKFLRPDREQGSELQSQSEVVSCLAYFKPRT
jgi:hypothetical protein